MANYSAWDWNINAFRVFRDAKTTSIGDDPVPPRPRPASILGAVPDKDVKVLPRNAQSIGTSRVAIGEIVRDLRLNTARDAAAAKSGGGDGIGALGDMVTWAPLAPVLVIGATVVAAIYLTRSSKKVARGA